MSLNLNLLKALLLRDLGDGLSVARGLFPTALGKNYLGRGNRRPIWTLHILKEGLTLGDATLEKLPEI